VTYVLNEEGEMSFWSSLKLARGGAAPVVTAAAIGAFIRELASTGALVGGEEPQCQIKYGRRVDADEKTTEVVERNEFGIGITREYPWDRSDTFPSLAAMADALATDRRKVYRAFLRLGDVHRDIATALTRQPSEANHDGLYLNLASFSVGPALVAGLASETESLVGWMDLTLSGPGYFYPWIYRQARERTEGVSLVRRMADVCRAAWPVPPVAASAKLIASRRQLDTLWLYDDLAMPQDWLWFVSESG
jgi:hypothetical protein